MKKSLSIILAIIMLFSVVNVSVFAASIATPKTTASNDVGGIKVYWSAISGAKKYNVYRRAGGSSTWVLAGTTTGTQIIDKGVSNGKYYAYSVRAYNSQGAYSAYNQKMTYTTKCVATPKLTSLVNDTNGLKLTWSAVSGASYRVYRRGAGSTTWTYLGTVSGTTYTDSKASNGAYWRFTVRAISSGYYSGFDTNGLYTIRLATPSSLKASHTRKGIDITWAKVNGATGYRVYRRGAGQTTWTYLGATTDTFFRDGNVTINQYYRYTIRATRGSIYSGFSTSGIVIQFATAFKDHFPREFVFTSGSSAWATRIAINADGSFTGTFTDGELGETGPDYPNGTVYKSTFSGKFKNIKQIDYTIYSMTLDSYSLTYTPGTTWFEDGRRYVATEPYGIEGGKNFILYTDGTPIPEIPDDAWNWYHSGNTDGKFYDKYCLYNVEGECPFFEYDY